MSENVVLAGGYASVMLSGSVAAECATLIQSEMCECEICECCEGFLDFGGFLDSSGFGFWVDCVGFLDCAHGNCGCRGFDVDNAAHAEIRHDGDELVVVEAVADALLEALAAVEPRTVIAVNQENETVEISSVPSVGEGQTCASLAVQLLQVFDAVLLPLQLAQSKVQPRKQGNAQPVQACLMHRSTLAGACNFYGP